MKVIDATWEKRNLGVETKEIVVEAEDTKEAVKETLQQTDAEYLVLKIPANRADLFGVAETYGFSFAEGMVQMESDLEKSKLPGVLERVFNAVSVAEFDEADQEQVKNEILAGLFSTDRISNDEHFSAEQAAKRYVGWINDEFKRGTSFYKYVYKDQPIGFFNLKEVESGIYDSYLGGIYKEYREKGCFGAIVKVPEVVRKLGGKKVLANVSTNNASQIRNLIMNGYNVEKINYIYVKHGEKKEGIS